MYRFCSVLFISHLPNPSTFRIRVCHSCCNLNPSLLRIRAWFPSFFRILINFFMCRFLLMSVINHQCNKIFTIISQRIKGITSYNHIAMPFLVTLVISLTFALSTICPSYLFNIYNAVFAFILVSKD